MVEKRAATGASLAALVLFCALLLPAGAAAISGPEIVQRLSQQREANGIPGGLVERPDWSADCAKHNYYGAQTGELRHSEDPSSPFYSAEGNWAAENSVLASGSSWSQGNPWEEAPIHLIERWLEGPAVRPSRAPERVPREPVDVRRLPRPLEGLGIGSGEQPLERAGESVQAA